MLDSVEIDVVDPSLVVAAVELLVDVLTKEISGGNAACAIVTPKKTATTTRQQIATPIAEYPM